MFSGFFFFNDTATTEIYTLSLHDALPICEPYEIECRFRRADGVYRWHLGRAVALRDTDGSILRWFGTRDRKSTRLNSSHANISYAVFCLKKKKNLKDDIHMEEMVCHIMHR